MKLGEQRDTGKREAKGIAMSNRMEMEEKKLWN